MRYLSSDDIRRALPMADAIDAMKKAFVQVSCGRIDQPPRVHIDVPAESGTGLFMPCHDGGSRLLGVKMITLFDRNRDRGLPRIQALVLLADGATGVPLAVLEGATLTAIRTGAASGAATDALARPDADVAAVFGAGVQARTQLEAVCAVRKIRRARVYDADAGAATRFALEAGRQFGIPVERAASPAAALKDAGIVCTATTSATPVFKDTDLAPGAHINAVGSYKPEVAEVPADTVIRARVIVDQVASALEEAGDLIQPLRRGLIRDSHIVTELGTLLAGHATGRRDAEEITLFKSVGLAIQDLNAAARALENAKRLGLGIELPR